MKTFLLSQHLDVNGDGSGNMNANGDYSVTAEDFYIAAQPGYALQINRLIVSIEDTNGFQASEYGNLGSALTNGVTIAAQQEDGTDYFRLTCIHPVKSNAQWGSYCFDVDLKTWGPGNELLLVRWTFSKHGASIFLNEGQKLTVTVNDDLQGLVSHKFLAQGLRHIV